MRNMILVGLTTFLIGVGFAEDLPTASYPIMLAGNKPLAVGTQVWANIGDGPCTYPGARDSKKSWLPIGDRNCFAMDKANQAGEYRRAIVKAVGLLDKRWVYKVEYTDIPPIDYGGVMRKLQKDAFFDKACKFVNLPSDLAEWSQYIIKINW